MNTLWIKGLSRLIPERHFNPSTLKREKLQSVTATLHCLELKMIGK